MAKLVQPVNPPSLAKPAGYSHGVEVQGGKTLYVAGQVAFGKDGTLVGPATSSRSSSRSARTSRPCSWRALANSTTS